VSGGVLRPVSISLALFTFQVLSGIDPVLFYTVDIFQAAGSNLDEYYATIIIGAVQVVRNPPLPSFTPLLHRSPSLSGRCDGGGVAG
jgi:hypothetical protein